ncbi:hypothetical protein, partial [Alkalihalobacillus alcalophilus]|uniref:hypothetical protein n=1 Tax=Alkalihalobacillus alcalophilus TaxID=1445 RepID=UPI001B3B4443
PFGQKREKIRSVSFNSSLLRKFLFEKQNSFQISGRLENGTLRTQYHLTLFIKEYDSFSIITNGF